MTGTLKRPMRSELIDSLIERDGDECFYCQKDFSVQERTIDHYYPQSTAVQEGWTYDEIWDLSNLRLSCKPCNSKKGNLIPDENGVIPKRGKSTFRYRRDKRSQRADICTSCRAGRNLQENEWCNACGSGPMPERFPKWRQMSVKECDHDLFFCVSCTIWSPELRRPVMYTLIEGGNGYE